MKYKILIGWIPLLILIGVVIYSIYTVTTTNIVLANKQFAGIGFDIIIQPLSFLLLVLLIMLNFKSLISLVRKKP